MTTPEILTLLPVVIVLASSLAARIRVPPAILLVLTGVLLALVPGLPTVRLAPRLILLFVLPPLVYSSAVAMSWREFRFNLRSISLLAVGCVVFTTAAAAAAAHWLLRLSWAEGFVLGAIVSPPDAVAPLAIARRLQVPRRLLVILEGEGLANDATALVLYRFAIGAVTAGVFSLPHALAAFVAISVGEVLWGLAVGWFMLRWRRRVENPRLEILLSVLTPFIAYWPPEHLGGSGVLATVTAGLYISWNGLRLISAATRLQGIFFWNFLIFVTEGMVFLVTGLQARTLVGGIRGYSLHDLGIAALVVSGVVIGSRFVWVFPATYLPRWLSPRLARRDPAPSWHWPFAIGFTGIRGVVSLAAALAIPLTIEGGEAYPQRDLILFLTFVVIIATLVGQGLLLPPVMRMLGMANAGRQEEAAAHAAELTARREAGQTALTRLETLAVERELPQEIVEPIRRDYADLLRHLEARASGDAKVAQREAVELELLATERDRINDLYRAGRLQDAPRRRIERDLDLRAAELETLDPHGTGD
jgi:CPA1 family monovalent cation:H+ antiporter